MLMFLKIQDGPSERRLSHLPWRLNDASHVVARILSWRADHTYVLHLHASQCCFAHTLTHAPRTTARATNGAVSYDV